MHESAAGRPSRLRIGYVASTIADKNGFAIWSGIAEVARDCDVDVICFAGSELHEPGHPAAPANAVYELVDRGRLDGLILWGSSLGNYAPHQALLDFCQSFDPLPLVSIGMALPGVPGVVIDSYEGTRAALAHLIEAHGRRRLACIRGPASSREAVERYRAYLDALAAFGLPCDEALISPSYPWGEEGGLDGIRLFLDERRVAFDAVVAANDRLALGALAALKERGRRVPEDISLVGFDDGQAGRVSTPPLTTIRIRIVERGRQAMRLLLAHLAGQPVPQEVSLPARLVIRQSCGCPDPSVQRAQAPISLRPARRRTLLSEERKRIVAQMDRELEAIEEASPRSGELLDAFLQTLDGLSQGCLGHEEDAGQFAEHLSEKRPSTGSTDSPAGSGTVFRIDAKSPYTYSTAPFLAALEAILSASFAAGGDISAWQDGVSALREGLLPYLEGQGARLARAESLWHQARVMIGERALAAQGYADWRAGRQSARLYALNRALAAAQDVAELMDILARELPGLGIGAAWLALYEDASRPAGGCRLVLAYDEDARAALPPEGQHWLAPALACGQGLRGPGPPRSLVIKPLYYGGEALGFFMMDAAAYDGQMFAVLQGQIGGALKSVLLLQENVALYHQALEAQRAAQEGQRLAEEADLLKSRFLSMVSHELRTPLVLLEGLSEMMLRQGLSSGGGGGDRPPLPEPYRQDMERIRATSRQLGGLVRDVLDLARSQMGQLRLSLRPLNVAEALQPVILVGEQMATSKGLAWRITVAPDLPPVMGDPARLQQVALNLVSNAVKFTSQGEIGLQIEPAPASQVIAGQGNAASAPAVTVSVSDTGPGVPPEDQEAIFDEFRQSQRTAARGYGGLGVGLAICRQIVTLHGGTIGIHSSGEEDGGSTFFFTLPAIQMEMAAGPSGESSGAGPADNRVVILSGQGPGGEELAAHLARQGFEVDVMPLGPASDWWSRIVASPPGALVLDLEPSSDYGWQIIDLLKQNPATQDVPVLFYSLLGPQSGLGQEGGAVLALDYAAKPLAAGALADALSRLGLAQQLGARGEAVLITDDDPGALALHAQILRSGFPGCHVLTASNGREALEVMAEGEPPALVLLDLMMPELDGFGVLEAMQAAPRTRLIPVIVLTAQSLTEEDMVRLNRGVASVLQKGMFSGPETLAHVERALTRTGRLGTEARRLARKTIAYIHEHYPEPIGRDEMAAHAGVSPRHLTRCFTQETGLSPIDYLTRYRIVQAKRLLSEGQMTVTEVMEATGFGDSSYFAKVFRRETGVSPSAWQRNPSRGEKR